MAVTWHLTCSSLARLWHIETLHSDQLNSADQNIGRVADLTATVIVLIFAVVIGAQQYRARFETASFYQPSFGPALNFACNGRFNRIASNDAVDAFLVQRTRALPDCRDVRDLSSNSLGSLETSMAYLELSSAIVWKAFGIDWKNLYIVAAVLTAGFALASYALLRVLCESRFVCLILTILVTNSFPIRSQIAHLRDFSKAPFLIGAIACLGWAIVRARTSWGQFVCALLAGSLVGLGLGFRPDMTAILPIACLTPALLLSDQGLRGNIARVGRLWCGFFLAYFVAQVPLLQLKDALSEQASFIPHVLVLGFAEDFFHAKLGMPETSYSALRAYLDEAAYAVVQLFSGTPALWGTALYDQKGAELFKSMLLLLPYDSFIRLFYTANAVGRLDINRMIWGFPLLSMIPLFLFARSISFLFVAICFGIFGAVLSLQFDPRHAFYMVLLGPALIALSLSGMSRLLSHYPNFHPPLKLRMKCTAVFATTAIVTIILCATSISLAQLQRHALQNLIQVFGSTDWQTIKHSVTADGIEPKMHMEGSSSALANSTEDKAQASLSTQQFARLTFRLESTDSLEPSDTEVSWTSKQEDVAAVGEGFSATAVKSGYVVASEQIDGETIASGLAFKSQEQRQLWLSIDGESTGADFDVGILSQDRTRFQFNERLASGRWHVLRPIAITPDFSRFTIVFSKNSNAHGSIHVKSARLLTAPASKCISDRIEARYNYDGKQITVGGFPLPNHNGLVTYYFPMTFYGALLFHSLDLHGLHPACILDWSIAKQFYSGVVPAELLLIDGKLLDFQRGSWKEIWQDFTK